MSPASASAASASPAACPASASPAAPGRAVLDYALPNHEAFKHSLNNNTCVT